MNRITPKRVVGAFRSITATPIRGTIYEHEDSGEHSCGLNAVAAHENKAAFDSMTTMTNGGVQTQAIKSLGLSDSYVLGFYNGWDNERCYANVAESYFFYDVGFRDGVESWNAVVESGLVKEQS
jgi:hypothetical protein